MPEGRLKTVLTGKELLFGLLYFPCYLYLLPQLLRTLLPRIGLPAAAATLNYFYYGINLLAVLLIFRRFLRENLRQFLEAPGRVIRLLPRFLALTYLGNLAVSLPALALVPGFTNRNNDALIGMMDGSFVFVLLMGVVLAPLIEECLFRGLIFSTVQRISRPIAYAATALFFAAVHVVPYLSALTLPETVFSLLQYLPAALVLCRIYERADTLLAPMLLHGSVNLISILLLKLAVPML